MEAPVSAATPPNSSALVPLRPALPPSVRLGFTVLYTALYGGLFLVVYAQLWLLLRYRHKRWSYQSVFLFLSLLWAALRTTLFSFYFRNTLEANRLPAAVHWLFYCFPVCLQFFTLSHINLYFTQVLLKARVAFTTDADNQLCAARCAYGTLNAVFLCVNVACAALADHGDSEGMPSTWNLVLVRVLVNDSLFIFNAVLLAALLLLLTRHSRPTASQLTRKGVVLCRTAGLGAAVIFLFTSRACYNLSVLFLSWDHHVESFDFDWYNVSDQADLRNDLGDRGYLAFGAILFIWELLPSTLLIIIFRVRRPSQEVNNLTANDRVLPRPLFFDDPQGSNEEAAVPWTSTYQPQPSWYAAETTPLLFANNPPNQNHQHHTFYSTPQN
ncbi:integral membrane protein GPR137-like [Stigmatopora argus]